MDGDRLRDSLPPNYKKSNITLESMVLEYSDSVLKSLIDEMLKSPINVETIIKPFNFDTLISVKKQQKIHEDVEYWTKRLKERGMAHMKECYSEEGLKRIVEKYYNAQFFLAYLNAVISLVLDKFGVGGHMRITYRNLSRFVASQMTKKELYEIPTIIEAKITEYVNKYTCNYDIAKVVALISAKVTYFFMKLSTRIW